MNNFARRESCFRCSEPKPAGAGGRYDDRDRDYYDDRDRYRDSRSPKHVDYSKHKSSSMSSIAGDMSKRRELWRCAALHRLKARARVRAAARRGSKLGGERPA